MDPTKTLSWSLDRTRPYGSCHLILDFPDYQLIYWLVPVGSMLPVCRFREQLEGVRQHMREPSVSRNSEILYLLWWLQSCVTLAAAKNCPDSVLQLIDAVAFKFPWLISP